MRSLRSRAARRKMGIIPSECCTPYMETNVPRKGEVIAFSESSATPYVNSVCAARTHRESANSALAAAVTGRVPCYGLLLDENRKGNLLVKVEARLKDDFDYHMLGYNVGKEAQAGIPVFSGRTPWRPFPEELTSLGAELATSGAVPMYHIVGFTPEAPDEASAFGGKAPEKVLTVTDRDLKRTRELISQKRDRIDVVIFGCPHYNLAQVRDAARLLEGKRIKKGIDLWILTSACTKDFATRLGYVEIINRAGGHVISGTCIDQVCWERLYRGKVCMTDSPKGAYYTAHRGIDFVVDRRSECIGAALRGGV
jgi:predicted aconitase